MLGRLCRALVSLSLALSGSWLATFCGHHNTFALLLLLAVIRRGGRLGAFSTRFCRQFNFAEYSQTFKLVCFCCDLFYIFFGFCAFVCLCRSGRLLWRLLCFWLFWCWCSWFFCCRRAWLLRSFWLLRLGRCLRRFGFRLSRLFLCLRCFWLLWFGWFFSFRSSGLWSWRYGSGLGWLFRFWHFWCRWLWSFRGWCRLFLCFGCLRCRLLLRFRLFRYWSAFCVQVDFAEYLYSRQLRCRLLLFCWGRGRCWRWRLWCLRSACVLDEDLLFRLALLFRLLCCRLRLNYLVALWLFTDVNLICLLLFLH